MEEAKDLKQIDFIKIYKAAKKYRKSYLYSLPIAFFLSCFIIACVPRYYICTVKLAPEMSSFSSNSLGDIAASFGFDIGGTSASSGDAIFPELYPELMNSADFLFSLFSIRVENIDGTINTTYYDYINNHQQKTWWSHLIGKIKNIIIKKGIEDTRNPKNAPFWMTKEQEGTCKYIQGNILCDVDKKNYVISISVTDQDPLISATMADSVKSRLQTFITKYRTNKAIADMEYTKKICADAKKDYDEARRMYAMCADANVDVALKSYELKLTELENEMQLKFNNYSTISTQLQASVAKIQERTPAFTTLQSATVPNRPAGPKRMIFVAAITLLTFICTTIRAAYKDKCF